MKTFWNWYLLIFMFVSGIGFAFTAEYISAGMCILVLVMLGDDVSQERSLQIYRELANDFSDILIKKYKE